MLISTLHHYKITVCILVAFNNNLLHHQYHYIAIYLASYDIV